MVYQLIINIQTDIDLSSWEMGKKILSPIFLNEKLSPQRVSTFGEVSKDTGFVVRDLDDCQKYWATEGGIRVNGSYRNFLQDFHWKRMDNNKSVGSVNFKRKFEKRESGGSLYFQSKIWEKY
jgi:hypothetical protein